MKNRHYFEKTEITLFNKLYEIIESEKIHYSTFVQIIVEFLKNNCCSSKDIKKLINLDIESDSLYDDTGVEILNLIVFYWDFEPVQFEKYKEYLAARSPFCKIILALKHGSENKFNDLFNRYLEEMKDKYKSCPNLHQIMLQKDRKYLLNHKIFSVQYRKFENSCNDMHDIVKDSELLDLHDDFIFTLVSSEQQKIKDQILESTKDKEEMLKMLETIDSKEIVTILFARSEEKPENLLEQMLQNGNIFLYYMLGMICKSYGMETFFTKKMLMMVIIKIIELNFINCYFYFFRKIQWENG